MTKLNRILEDESIMAYLRKNAHEQYAQIRGMFLFAMLQADGEVYTDMLKEIQVFEQPLDPDNAIPANPLSFIDSRTEHDTEKHQYDVWALVKVGGKYCYVCPNCGLVHTTEHAGKIRAGCANDKGFAYYPYEVSDGGISLPVDPIILHAERKQN